MDGINEKGLTVSLLYHRSHQCPELCLAHHQFAKHVARSLRSFTFTPDPVILNVIRRGRARMEVLCEDCTLASRWYW